MEEFNKDQNQGTCSYGKKWGMMGDTCSGCGRHHCGLHLFKLLLIVIILAIVLCVGVRIGEMKGSSGRDYYSGRSGYDYNYPMMLNRGWAPATIDSAPAVPVAPAKAAQ